MGSKKTERSKLEELEEHSTLNEINDRVQCRIAGKGKRGGPERRDGHRLLESRLSNLSRAPGNESSCLACARGLRNQRFPDLCTTENTTRLSLLNLNFANFPANS